jgi:hypothetical protein
MRSWVLLTVGKSRYAGRWQSLLGIGMLVVYGFQLWDDFQ